MEEGISILIAAYNADKYIKECINSITTITPHEILVGVDGCKKTLNVVNKLKNENLKVFNKEKNTGAYDTWNMLIPKASFNHILIFAADDIMIDGFLDNAISELNNFDFMHIRCKTFSDNADDDGHIWITDGVILIRTEVIMSVNGYQRWQCSADTELKLRLIHHGYLNKASNSVGFKYRRHHNSLSSTCNLETGKGSDIRNYYRKIIDDNIERNVFPDPTDGVSSHFSKGSD